MLLTYTACQLSSIGTEARRGEEPTHIGPCTRRYKCYRYTRHACSKTVVEFDWYRSAESSGAPLLCSAHQPGSTTRATTHDDQPHVAYAAIIHYDCGVVNVRRSGMSDRQPCPVCGQVFPIDELPLHVDLHFHEGDPQEVVDLLSEPEGSPAAAAPKRARPGPDLDDDLVACPYGCGAEIALSDLESHELAHRWACCAVGWPPSRRRMALTFLARRHSLQDTDAALAVGEAERQLRDQEEAEQFEKLRSKYGFSDTV
jgi:hypothetical protein